MSIELNDSFFQRYPVKQFSPQLFVYFKNIISDKGELTNMVTNASSGQLSKARQQEVISEEQSIAAIDSPQELVRMMKRLKESRNRTILRDKALAMEAETMPLIIEKLIKTANDTYVECAMSVLLRCDKVYIDELLNEYKNIRYPYAQSMVAMLLGIRNVGEVKDMLADEVVRFEADYPQETYEQGPLIGLYALCNKQLG